MPPSETVTVTEVSHPPYFTFSLERDFTFSLKLSLIAIVIVIAFVLVIKLIKYFLDRRTGAKFEIDKTEMGLGSTKVSFKPNREDQQIAYKIWVELSTRKIGIPIDLEHDVISEIYDSWYGFFSVTRELIKDIPVSKVKYKSTQKVIQLSIDVLNEGLRPHLTTWQARFRHWYDRQLESKNEEDIDPQFIQRKYPKFDDLKDDLLEVNKRLIRYREKMRELVLGNDLKPGDTAIK